MFNFRKSIAKAKTRKESVVYDKALQNLMQRIRNSGTNFHINRTKAFDYYTNGILGEVVESIADPIIQINKLYLYDAKGIRKDQSGIVDFITNRRFGGDLSSTLENLVIDLKVYGCCFVVFTMDRGKPFSMDIYDAKTAVFDNVGRIIRVKIYDTSTETIFFEYRPNRFRDATGSLELCYIKFYSGKNLEPKVPANKISKDLYYLDNLGIKRIGQLEGVSLDFVVSPDSEAPDQVEVARFKKEFMENKSGVTGERVFFADSRVKVSSISQTNKEGEFLQTSIESIKRCYNWGKVPLALKLTDATTYNNMHVAKYMLITDACIPLLKRALNGLYNFLQNFYNEPGFIYINEADIPALQDKKVEEAIKLRKNELLTVNEARQAIGFPDMPADMQQEKPSGIPDEV